MACYVAGNAAVVHTALIGAAVCDCGETRIHGPQCRCADCRHDRFNPGPPSMTKRQRRDRAHGEALVEDERRDEERTTTKEAA